MQNPIRQGISIDTQRSLLPFVSRPSPSSCYPTNPSSSATRDQSHNFQKALEGVHNMTLRVLTILAGETGWSSSLLLVWYSLLKGVSLSRLRQCPQIADKSGITPFHAFSAQRSCCCCKYMNIDAYAYEVLLSLSRHCQGHSVGCTRSIKVPRSHFESLQFRFTMTVVG